VFCIVGTIPPESPERDHSLVVFVASMGRRKDYRTCSCGKTLGLVEVRMKN
jgi:hypothetical protein